MTPALGSLVREAQGPLWVVCDQQRGGKDSNPDCACEPKGVSQEVKGVKRTSALAKPVSGWLIGGKTFYASGRVWDVPKLLAAYGDAPPSGVCLAFMLSRRTAPNKLKDCPCPTEHDHLSPTSPAHVLPEFELTKEVIAKFSRPSTSTDRAALRAPSTMP